jgi:carboxypeptidase T
MKHYLLLLSCCFLLFSLRAQTSERYASVRISLVGKNMADLVLTGIETDHGQYYPGRSITTVLSTKEIESVQKAGFQTEILIADLTQHYLEQRNNPPPVAARNSNCDESSSGQPQYVTPANYSYGTMGGYLTYDQMMAEFDNMRLLYPNLISARNITSDTILTWGGRPIYNIKISDNPDQDEPEREVLYTALHHAREPNSASQLIFYMWYLLENYDTRPDIQALVNNLEMYFVPCINVDGYLYNEETNPDGGGYWRKNRRDNLDGSFGIDLNRNYGYFWGDFGGSSPNPASEIYRGPEAFSEPESRTIRDFCRAHDFLFVYNYHTSGNLFIYPWAYSDSPADFMFIIYAQHFTRENDYHFGTTSETVGYSVNGSSDDWMYAEKGSYSYTPEVGQTGFWPMPDEIDALNKDNLWQNLSMAYSALRYGEAKDLSYEDVSGAGGNISIELMRYGLLDGPINVSLVPFSSNISSTTVTYAFDIDNLTAAVHEFPFQLNAGIQAGEAVVFLLNTDNGLWTKTDTLRKIYGTAPAPGPTVAFQDNLNNTTQWDGNWAITTETFHSAPACMTDSPNAYYEPSQVSISTLIPLQTIPPNALSANLRFFAKWDIEEDWDYTSVVAYTAAGTATSLCGLYTEPGVNVQENAPVYDGLQIDWVEECMSLSDYIGQTISFEFQFVADGFQEADGFYFDDVRIEYTLPASSVTHIIPLNLLKLSQNEPNPAAQWTLIQWNNEQSKLGDKANLLIFNALGEIVLEQPVNLSTEKSVRIDTRSLSPGFYTYLLRNEQGQSPAMKMSIAR